MANDALESVSIDLICSYSYCTGDSFWTVESLQKVALGQRGKPSGALILRAQNRTVRRAIRKKKRCLELNIERILILTSYHMCLYCPCGWRGKNRYHHISLKHSCISLPTSLNSIAFLTISLSLLSLRAKMVARKLCLAIGKHWCRIRMLGSDCCSKCQHCWETKELFYTSFRWVSFCAYAGRSGGSHVQVEFT